MSISKSIIFISTVLVILTLSYIGSLNVFHITSMRPNENGKILTRQFDILRPYAAGFIDSQTYPIRVHYRIESYKTYAEKVLSMAEYSWNKQVNVLGFQKALSDLNKGGNNSIDIYLTTETRTNGGSYAVESINDPTPFDKKYNRSGYIAVYEGIKEDIMPVYVAHELNHVLQFGYDFAEHDFFEESSAVYMEDIIYDEINDYYGFIDDFQEKPYLSINNNNATYPYGGVLFTTFIDEFLYAGNGITMSQIWRETPQKTEINEPDFVDILTDMAFDYQGILSFEELYMEFAEWRYFIGENDDGYHYDEGYEWGDSEDKYVWLSLKTSFDNLPVEFVPAQDHLPEDIGSNYIEIDTSNAPAGSKISIEFEGDNTTNWAISAIYWYEDKQGNSNILGYSDANGLITKEIPINDSDRVILVIANTGRDNFDIDDEAVEKSYSLKIVK